jgi:glycosyltransferase involved in cell wall biosynthesis
MNIWLDVTTTLGWMRPASGIVRVEAETARCFLSAENQNVRFCSFDKGAASYFEVSRDHVSAALLQLDAGGQAWQSQSPYAGLPTLAPAKGQLLSNEGRVQLACTLPRELTQTFSAGDVYISLGLDWDQKDMGFLYNLKRQLHLKVLLFCYDIIPILFPHYCVAGVPEKFPGYFADAAWCADKILCISDCSRRDLAGYLESVGAPVPALDVVRLGSNVTTKADTPPSSVAKKIDSHRFILFVSTIESRKNHKVLCQAYQKLLKEGHKDLPLLIFVGMKGWGVDDLILELQSNKQLKPYVRILEHISDSDLVYLYSKSMFTVYPSLYEGWGLPVAESLACGKFCLASSAASIPEVGGNLIEYVDPGDKAAWAARLLWYFQNPDELAAREFEIKRNYQRISWHQTGAAIFDAAVRLAENENDQV